MNRRFTLLLTRSSKQMTGRICEQAERRGFDGFYELRLSRPSCHSNTGNNWSSITRFCVNLSMILQIDVEDNGSWRNQPFSNRFLQLSWGLSVDDDTSTT